MKYLIVSLLATCALVFAETGDLKFFPLTNDWSRSVSKCVQEGYMCDSCANVSFCIAADGIFFQEHVKTCDLGSTCLNGACSSDPNPECGGSTVNNYEFTCRRLGIFPHPFDTCSFFMCVPIGTLFTPIEVQCPKGYAFDVRTGLCRIKLIEPATCKALIPTCTAPLIRGAISNHPSMYYICLTNQDTKAVNPEIFLCPDDQVYNSIAGKCEIPSTDTGLNSTTGKCLKTGNFYDPTKNCFSYNECSTINLAPIKRSCTKMYFDRVSRKCVDFSCALL